MILSGHQPNYWPYPGYFGKIMNSDRFMYVTNVQFEKKSWQNRNRIKTSQGIILLSIPTLTKGRFDQFISDVEIDSNVRWKEKHYKSIISNYCKATYFSSYKDFIGDLYSRDWHRLMDICIYITNYILGELNIKTEILYDSDLAIEGSKTNMLVDMCKKAACDTYLSNIGSQSYVDLAIMKTKEIDHIYIDYVGKEYNQQFSDFVPFLSILDMLLNCGKDRTIEILSDQRSYRFSEKNALLPSALELL